MTPSIAIGLLAIAMVVGAGGVDAVRYEIPDWISVMVATLAVGFGLLTPGFGWLGHGAAVVAMFAFGLLAFARGWLGGGDVKLMTAIAAWAGLRGLAMMFLATSLAGGVLALVCWGVRRLNGSAVVAGRPLPYAVAIAAGTIWWLWATGGGPAVAR